MSDKSYNRNINIYINGKKVANDISSIKKEMYNLTNELARTTRGTKEYYEKAAEVKRLKNIINEHNKSITATKSSWEKMKSAATTGIGYMTAAIGAIVGAYQSLKTIIFSTDALGDKFEATLSGWKSGLDAIARAIATMDFKNFGRNIKEAIEEGKRYAEANDLISDKLRALKFREAEVSSEIIKAREIENSALSTKEKAIEAGKRAIKLEEELATIRTDIAAERYDNELKNAAVITGQTPEIIESYLRRDSALLINLETGEKYLELQRKISNLQSAESASISPETGVKMLDLSAEIKSAKQSLSLLGPEAATYAQLFNDLGKLVDEKKDRIVGAYEAMKQAETSAIENTLRIRTKTASLMAADQREGKIPEDIITYVADSMNKGMTLREMMAKQDDEFRQKQRDNLKSWINSVTITTETEIEIESEKYDRIEEKRQEDIEKEREAYEQKVLMVMDYASAVGSVIGQAFADQEMSARDAAKQLLIIALDALRQYAKIAIAQATMKQVGEKGFIGIGTAAILSALIEAALSGVESSLKKNLYTGGFTEWGGKYEPKGIVHGGEWVANSEMVASPVTGPIIRALEGYRQAMPQYYSGGAPGSSASASTSGPLTDPRLSRAIEKLNSVADMLLNNGVRMNFGYREADGVRTAMTKLEDLESGVTM